MYVQDLLNYLLHRYPVTDAEPWDHVGLSVGDPHDTVRRVAISLDATEETLRFAQDSGCNVLVTHHPVYIKAPSSFCPPESSLPSASGAVYTAIRLGISIISLHTNLDRSFEVRELLPGLLGERPLSSLEFPADPSRRGLGSIARIEAVTLGELCERSSIAFDTTPRVWGDPQKSIRTIAIMGGSLGDFGSLAVEAGADAVVCGEAGYHVCQDLALRGTSVILLGHDASEYPFVDILANSVCESGLSPSVVAKMKFSHQWWTYIKGDRS